MENDSFEARLKRLEEIVAKVESGQLSLEETLALVEEGQNLSKSLNKTILEAEKKLESYKVATVDEPEGK